MRRGLFAIALVAACGGQGADIEVHPASKPIDSVELWLAYNLCRTPDGRDCDGIGWPNAQEKPSGPVFTLGDDDKVIRTDVIVDGVAQLHLDATAEDAKPALIAAVGFMGTQVVGVQLFSDAQIPRNDQAHWRIDLEDVGPATTEVSVGPGNGPDQKAIVWARKPSSTLPDATGYAGCLAYQKWDGSQWVTKYFVPPGDPDCDGDPPDCNPYWYNASTSNARCVAPSSLATLADVCTVGTSICKSETGDISCAMQSAPIICVPSAVCAACADEPDLQSCLKSQVPTQSDVQMAGVPLQVCPFMGDPDGPCLNSTNPVGYKASFFIKGGVCTPNAMGNTIMLRQLFNPLMGGNFMLTLGTTVITGHASTITTPTMGCSIDLTWTGGAPPTTTNQPIVIAVSYGPGREVLVPVLLDFQMPNGGGACLTTMYATQDCRAVGNWPELQMPGDTMFKCAM